MRFQSIRAWTISALFVLAAASAFAQAQPSQPSAAGDDPLKAAHQQLLHAAQQGDKEALGRLLADDLTWVMPNGKVSDKREFVGAVGPAPREVNIEQIRPFGKIAIVTGTAHFEDGRDSRFLQEWVNQDGQWKLMAHEGTLVGSSAPAAPTGTSGAMSSGTSGSATSAAPAGGSVAPTLNSDDERAIWKAQQDLLTAYLKGDSATYGKLTTNDYIRVSADGQRQGRSDFLQTVKQNAGKSGGRLEMSDVQIAVNGDTARVIFTTWGTLPGGEQMSAARVTRIFEKRNGQWQQAAIAFAPIREQ